MQLPPAWFLASLPPPNYVDPVTRGHEKVILNLVLYPLLVIVISIRVYARVALRKFFGPDDTLILIALVPTTVFFIVSLLADLKFLWIRHSNDIPRDQIPPGLKLVMCTEVMFAAACTLTKLSMLMFVWRMLCSSPTVWRKISLLAIFVVALQGTIFCITVIFQCRPPSHYWVVTEDPQPECINQTTSLLVAGIINTMTDFLVVALPIRTVWSLRLPYSQALPIVALFCFGFISCICGIIRTYYTYKVSISFDTIWDSYPVWITAALELYIGIICASIPATKPFFDRFLPGIFGPKSPPDDLTSDYYYSNNVTSQNMITQRNSVRITTSSSSMNQPLRRDKRGEELADMEKGSGHKSECSVTTITGGSWRDEPGERVMQEVDYVRPTR